MFLKNNRLKVMENERPENYNSSAILEPSSDIKFYTKEQFEKLDIN
jgi:hypothetical protein